MDIVWYLFNIVTVNKSLLNTTTTLMIILANAQCLPFKHHTPVNNSFCETCGVLIPSRALNAALPSFRPALPHVPLKKFRYYKMV